MVIKGSARAAPGELAYHLLREDTNEIVTVLELSGVASLDLRGALAELDGMGAGSRSRRTLYHASINTPVSEQLDPNQQRAARQRLAERMGLANQPYAVVQHVKHGRQHTHVVWSRVDVGTGRAIHDGFNYRKHEEVARELEREFGHERVLGAHVRDKTQEKRPERGPSWGEQRQVERTGLTIEAAKAAVSHAWDMSRSGIEFMAALKEEGFEIARGDRRDFVLVDFAGEIHSATRRLSNVTATELRHRMRDVDREALPTVDEVRTRQLQDHQRQLRQESIADRERIAALYGQHPDEGPQHVGAIERLRLLDWNSSTASQGILEAASAVHQLKQTMGHELAGVVLTTDRRTADRTWQDIIREGATLENRMPFRGGNLDQRKAIDQPTPEPELQRPSAALFVQILGKVIDLYRNEVERSTAFLLEQQGEIEPPPPPEGRRETIVERMRRLNPFTDEQREAERLKLEAARKLREELGRDRSRQRTWEPDRTD